MELPIGTILIWNSVSTPPIGWIVLSTYSGSPIKGYNHTSFSSSTPTAYAGSNHTHTASTSSSSQSVAHTHDSKSITIGTSSSVGDVTASPLNKAYCANKTHNHSMTMTFPTHTASHSHPITLSIGTSNPVPLHKTAILIVKTA